MIFPKSLRHQVIKISRSSFSKVLKLFKASQSPRLYQMYCVWPSRTHCASKWSKFRVPVSSNTRIFQVSQSPQEYHMHCFEPSKTYCASTWSKFCVPVSSKRLYQNFLKLYNRLIYTKATQKLKLRTNSLCQNAQTLRKVLQLKILFGAVCVSKNLRIFSRTMMKKIDLQ